MLALIKKHIPCMLKRKIKRLLNNCLESARYFKVHQRVDVKNCLHIIFVCKGNICRSAFAEHYFKQKLQVEGLKVESCGIDADPGCFSPPEAVLTADRFAVDLKPHRSKGLDECDVEKADLILGMEYWHYRKLVEMYPEKAANVFLLREFAPWPARWFCNIYDPYGLNLTEFDDCFQIMKKALDGLAKENFQL